MTSEPAPWTLAHIWGALKKLWSIIVITAALGGGVAYVDAASTTPLYNSTSTLSFSVSQGTTAADLANGSTYMQSQMLTYAQLATSSAVLQPVIDTLALQMRVQELKNLIIVTIPQNTFILKIQVSAPDAEQAADLANSIAQSLSTVVSDTSPNPTSDDAPRIDTVIVDEAIAPRYQASPNKPKQTVMGVVAGMVVGLFIVLLWVMVDTRIPDEKELRRIAPAPVLGSVSRTRSSSKLWVTEDSAVATIEQFRRIRSALMHATAENETRRILMTSAGAGDGKSVVSANLALTLANLGSKVLLIDADLHTPCQSKIFDLEGAPGLSEILAGEATLNDAKHGQPNTTLDVLTSGELPGIAAELLSSQSMSTLLEDAARDYDFVIVDTPAVGRVADAILLAPLTDDVLVVVDATKTRRAGFVDAISSLEVAGGRIVGLVLNRGRAVRVGARRG